ncbi:MAG: helix-turn-helix transcriptional regulator [Cyclobacteriaceae bacterium]
MAVSLFENWTKQQATTSADEVIASVTKELEQLQKFSKSMFCIQDYRDLTVPYISANCEAYTGLNPEAFYANGLEQLLRLIHKDEIAPVLELRKYGFELINKINPESRLSIETCYKARLFHEEKNRYTNMQVVIRPLLISSDGKVLLELIEWTDISSVVVHHATDFHWEITYTNTSGKLIKKTPEDSYKKLTPAEEKVVKLLAIGKTSEEAAETLNLSKHTIDTHRRRMLKKFKCNNTTELLAVLRKA